MSSHRTKGAFLERIWRTGKELTKVVSLVEPANHQDNGRKDGEGH